MTVQRLICKYLKYGSVRQGTLVIDEVSQINIKIWHHLSVLKRFPVQFLCMGDENQYAAINNHWVMSKLNQNVFESTLLKVLCDYRRCVLREPKRSDTYLFNFYASLTK